MIILTLNIATNINMGPLKHPFPVRGAPLQELHWLQRWWGVGNSVFGWIDLEKNFGHLALVANAITLPYD